MLIDQDKFDFWIHDPFKKTQNTLFIIMYAVTAGSTDPLINMDKDTFYDVMQYHICL